MRPSNLHSPCDPLKYVSIVPIKLDKIRSKYVKKETSNLQ